MKTNDNFDEFFEEFMINLSIECGLDLRSAARKVKWETPPTPNLDPRKDDYTDELIQGYTAEQWQEIIDGGYLCEFSDNEWIEYSPESTNTGMLEKINKNNALLFKGRNTFNYRNCRPAQLKGVMRPIFVEPVDKDAVCVFFGFCLSHCGVVGEGSWSSFDKEHCKSYIEV